ncbi:hypothetical protein BBJ28_00002298 [Nothophytophthora sp. Chile5]|nr:hypothetical protein BBJ28_00002298 [Nothophytophthora sp. Chile5]
MTDKSKVVDLVPNGSNIPVTEENKMEYISLRFKWIVATSVSLQLASLVQGLFAIIPKELLSVFDHQELELLICGIPDVDAQDWKTHTIYVGERDERVIAWFWNTVHEFTNEQKARLLQFTTGSARVPVQGFKALTMNDGRICPFAIQCVNKEECLYPRAHTCFNRIDLPRYDAEKDMRIARYRDPLPRIMAQRAASSAQTWQPQRYLKFEQQRLRPALELLARVPPQVAGVSDSDGMEIIDLGAGTCNMGPAFLYVKHGSSLVMDIADTLCVNPNRNRWPEARVTFVDSSAAMLERAKQEHGANGSMDVQRCAYIEADFERFQPKEPADLIFSNAALHWVSAERHKTLLPRLLSFLKPGGTLAFQIPDSRLQPSHQLMVEAAKQLGLRERMGGVRWVTCERDPDFYYELFKNTDPDVELDMWATVYAQVLEGGNPVADFTGSTGLGPYLEALGGRGDPAADEFEQKYRELVAAAYPKQSDGKTLFNLKRFFVVATKAA